MSSPEHGPAHRGGRLGDVLSVSSAEFRRMQADRAAVVRVLALAELLDKVDNHFSVFHAELIREAVAGES